MSPEEIITDGPRKFYNNGQWIAGERSLMRWKDDIIKTAGINGSGKHVEQEPMERFGGQPTSNSVPIKVLL